MIWPPLLLWVSTGQRAVQCDECDECGQCSVMSVRLGPGESGDTPGICSVTSGQSSQHHLKSSGPLYWKTTSWFYKRWDYKRTFKWHWANTELHYRSQNTTLQIEVKVKILWIERIFARGPGHDACKLTLAPAASPARAPVLTRQPLLS